MTDKTFVYTNDWVVTDQDGNLVERMEWNPTERSEDGWRCPEPDCDYCLPEKYHPYETDPPTCDRYGHEEAKVMVPCQVVHCTNCSEIVRADLFLGHVKECWSE